MDKMIYCRLLKKDIPEGYCFELCNIATDDILLVGDKVDDWDKAQEVCKKCGRYEMNSEKTSSGGDYSEIYYFDDNGNIVDSGKATKCIIRECLENGTLLKEIYGICNQKWDEESK